jgi:hypothetical protein
LKYGVSLLISGARNCARDTRYTAPNQHRRVASRRTGGKDSLRSVFRLLRPSAAPFRRRRKGDNGNAVIKQSSSAGILQQLAADAGEPPVVRKSPPQRDRFGFEVQVDSGCRLWRQSL